MRTAVPTIGRSEVEARAFLDVNWPLTLVLTLHTIACRVKLTSQLPFGVNFCGKWRTAVLCVAVVCVSLTIASKGLGDEEAVSLQGDMPRYLMNGAYFHDVAADMPIRTPVDYTYRYFARYPALSLGHHAILLSLVEVIPYRLFGLSVSSARLAVLFFVAIGAVASFLLFRMSHGELTALLASLLFVTNPYIVTYSRVVMSEIPTLALVIASAYFLHAYATSGKRMVAVGFWTALVLSVYAKHLAVLMVPVYAIAYARRKGARALVARSVLVGAVLAAIVLLPLVPLTLQLSPINVALVSAANRLSVNKLAFWVKALWTELVPFPVLMMSAAALLAIIIRGDRRASFFTWWIGLFYLEIVALGVPNLRFAIYWIPPFCLLAATAIELSERRTWRVFATAIILGAIGYQSLEAWDSPMTRAGGYEQAARYVTGERKGDAVLFSSMVDTGFFVFFVRKHDPLRDMVVLRADKLLTTSRMDQPDFAVRIRTRAEIYDVLRRFGVAFVVLEDAEYPAGPLRWLQEEVKTCHFAERLRVPTQSNDQRLSGVDVVVYEYLNFSPAQRDVTLSMELLLVNRTLRINFDDLRRHTGPSALTTHASSDKAFSTQLPIASAMAGGEAPHASAEAARQADEQSACHP